MPNAEKGDRLQAVPLDSGHAERRGPSLRLAEELLWGMLLNHLFVAGRLYPGSDRWLRTMLFAAVICGRLDGWGQAQWPPDWPKAEWR